MKNNNLYNRIYEHSFSLLLTFSFYAVILALMLSCEDEKETTEIFWGEGDQIATANGTEYRLGVISLNEDNHDSFVEKKDRKGRTLWKIAHAAHQQALLITLDKEENPWVLFTIHHSDSDTLHTDNLPSQILLPQQPKHSVSAILARLDKANGNIVETTYLDLPANNIAELLLTIQKIGISEKGDIVVQTDSFTCLQASNTSGLFSMADFYATDSFSQLPLPLNSHLSQISEK